MGYYLFLLIIVVKEVTAYFRVIRYLTYTFLRRLMILDFIFFRSVVYFSINLYTLVNRGCVIIAAGMDGQTCQL